MTDFELDALVEALRGKSVVRPNKADGGTLSGHAAGEPFEKLSYRILKERYPDKIFKQYEFLNDLYLKNPEHISIDSKNALFASPVALFLLSRSEAATRSWSPGNLFEEKQDDTADILWTDNSSFDLIDVKTRNMSKNAMAPNIISAYKLAKACALMMDNKDFCSVDIHYVEFEWHEDGEKGVLKCSDASWRDLFKSSPESLYINWAAALQIQFHVSELDQDFTGTREGWARRYITHFVESAEARREMMYVRYVEPFKKYLGQ